MRTDCKIDNVAVKARKAEGVSTVKAGTCFIYSPDGTMSQWQFARSLGRVTAPALEGDRGPVDGWVLAMHLAQDGSSIYERWINPDWIMRVFPVPTKTAAFFFAETIPFAANTIRRLIEYGCMCERYIDGAAHTVAEWAAKDISQR